MTERRGAENTMAIIQYVIWGVIIIIGVILITGQGPAALRTLADLAALAGDASKKGTGEVIKNVIIPGA